MSHDDLADAIRVLQLQHEFIESQQQVIMELRVELAAVRDLRALVEQVKLAVTTTLRPCLKCGDVFPSRSKHHRLCVRCVSESGRVAALAMHERRRRG